MLSARSSRQGCGSASRLPYAILSSPLEITLSQAADDSNVYKATKGNRANRPSAANSSHCVMQFFHTDTIASTG